MLICNKCSFITINNNYLWITRDIVLSVFAYFGAIVIDIIIPFLSECLSKSAVACELLEWCHCEIACGVVCQENKCVIVWLVLGEGQNWETCALLSHVLVQSCSETNTLQKTIKINAKGVEMELIQKYDCNDLTVPTTDAISLPWASLSNYF